MTRTMLVAEWLALFCGLMLFAITEVYQSYILAGLALLAAAFALRIARTRRFIPATGLEVPIILIVFSAGIATWIAYNPQLAFLKFSRILGAVVLFYAIIDSINDYPNIVRNYWPSRWIASGFVVAAAVLAVYWPAQHNFTQEPVKFHILNAIGLAINGIVPILPGPTIHSNTGAGLLAVAAPFAAVLSIEFWRLRKRALSFTAILSTAIILGGLLLTGSRGAWLGLMAAFGLGLLAWVQRRWFQNRTAMVLFWGGVTVISISAIAVLLATGNINDLLGKLPDPTGALLDRPQVWSKGLPLIRDYMFTGIGLMSFYWNYSVYAILSPVGFLQHIHNLPLEIWIEQGILGIIGAVWGVLIIGRWAFLALDKPAASLDNPSSVEKISLLGWAGLAGVVVILVHGMVDVVFYVERTLPVMALPAGFAFLAVPIATKKPYTARQKFSRQWLPGILAAVIVLVGAFLFQQKIRAAFYANLGAITQSQIELPVYNLKPFQKVTLDQVRKELDLEPASNHFDQSLRSDQAQITALQRLASIALSRNDYEQALAYMETAWFAGHNELNTRIIYGDALVANGRLEQAAQVLTGIEAIENHLMYQSWYRYYTTGDIKRAVYALKTVLLINPNHQQAINSLKDRRYAPGLTP